MFQAEKRNAVYEQARRLVREFNCMLHLQQVSRRWSQRQRLELTKPRESKEKEMSLVNGRMEVKNLPRDEVQRYIKGQFFWDGEDILSFWQLQSPAFPMLAKVSKMILCIPATSASSECTFSSAGRVLEARRNRLNPGTVDAILFLHSAFGSILSPHS
ncbi:E3 SUMO-protein ligase ZBED1-like [Tachysurus ichikawai]